MNSVVFFFSFNHVTHKAERYLKRADHVLKRKVLPKTVTLLRSQSKSDKFNRSEMLFPIRFTSDFV